MVTKLRERYKYDRKVQLMLDIIELQGLSHLLYNSNMDKTVRLKIDLKNLIIAKGYSVASFARAVGIHRESMHRIISDEHADIKGSTMLKIAEMLNLSPTDIWELAPED